MEKAKTITEMELIKLEKILRFRKKELIKRDIESSGLLKEIYLNILAKS